MSRAEFIEKLEYLLQDLSQEDREDGISFYRDYLDEAGTEREQEVLREFGSPERIASIIRSNLQVDLEDGGIFSENGFEDERFREPGYQVVKRKDLPEVLEENRQRNDDGHAQTAGRERTEYEHGRSRKKEGTRRRILLPLLLVLVLFPSIRLSYHIFNNNIVNLAYAVAIFQNLPRFICMKMYFNQIFITNCY